MYISTLTCCAAKKTFFITIQMIYHSSTWTVPFKLPGHLPFYSFPMFTCFFGLYINVDFDKPTIFYFFRIGINIFFSLTVTSLISNNRQLHLNLNDNSQSTEPCMNLWTNAGTIHSCPRSIYYVRSSKVYHYVWTHKLLGTTVSVKTPLSPTQYIILM